MDWQPALPVIPAPGVPFDRFRPEVNYLFFDRSLSAPREDKEIVHCNFEWDRRLTTTCIVAQSRSRLYESFAVSTPSGYPFSFAYGHEPLGQFLTVKCLADTTKPWACLLTFKDAHFARNVVLTSSNPTITLSSMVSINYYLSSSFKVIPFSVEVRKWFDHRVVLPSPVEELQIESNAVLAVGSNFLLHVNRNLLAHRSRWFEEMFDKNPDEKSYDIPTGSPVNVQDFTRLAYRDPKFEFTGKNIGPLIKLCKFFNADDCLKECIDFCMRTRCLEKIDLAISLDHYPEYSALRTGLAHQSVLQHVKNGTSHGGNDFRVISRTLLGELREENLPPARDSLVAQLQVDSSELQAATEPWTFNTHILYPLDHDHQYKFIKPRAWGLKSWIEWKNNKFIPSITSDQTIPWFVEAQIHVHEYKDDNSHIHSIETFHATSETGMLKNDIKLEINADSGKFFKVFILVTRAMLFEIPLNTPDFNTANRFSNFKIIVSNKDTGVNAAFFTIKEIILGCSDYFRVLLSSRWTDDTAECTLSEIDTESIKLFLKLAYNPRIVINESNVVAYMNTATYFGMTYMVERIKAFMNGCDVAPNIKNYFVETYAGIVDFWKGDLPDELDGAPTDELIETWYKTSANPSPNAVGWVDFWSKIAEAVRVADERAVNSGFHEARRI